MNLSLGIIAGAGGSYTPPTTITVAGAGSVDANFANMPQRTDVDGKAAWLDTVANRNTVFWHAASGLWKINGLVGRGSDTYYTSNEDVADPTLVITWTPTGIGVLPVPTVTAP